MVAPKKRDLIKSLDDGNSSQATGISKYMVHPSEKISSDPLQLWLRTQELDPSLTQSINIEGVNCSTLPTTVVFISPSTAKKTLLVHGQLVVLRGVHIRKSALPFSSMDANKPSETQVHPGGAPEEGLSPAMIGEGHDMLETKGVGRRAVVRIVVSEIPTRGHVMLAQPLQVFLRLNIYSRMFISPLFLFILIILILLVSDLHRCLW